MLGRRRMMGREETVAIRSIRSLTVAPLLSAVVVLALFPASFAQSSIDEVHVVPRVAVESPTREIDASLDAHAKPIKKDVDLVLVPVTITDPMDRLVIGLEQDNFQVFDGKQPQEIKHFSSEDTPVSLGVVFKRSGSTKSKSEQAREAVGEFLKTANPQDEFFIITFADQPEEVSDFTSSVEDIQSKLLYTFPKGRTALLDAIYMGLTNMRHAKYPRKALLIISDGGDNHSRYTEGEIDSIVKEADVAVYAVGIYDRYFATREEMLGPALLGRMTALTGGQSSTIENPNELSRAARTIGTALRH